MAIESTGKFLSNHYLDDFEKDSLVFFQARQGTSFTRLDRHNGTPYVRYAVPVVMQDTCVACHNRPNFDFNQTWRVGDFRGARQVSMPLAGPDNLPWNMYLIGALGALVIGGTGMGLVWPVVNRLHHAKEKVTAQQTLLTNMINTSPSGIFMTDVDLNLMLANPALCQSLDYAPGDLVGQPLAHLYRDGHHQMVADLQCHTEPAHDPRTVREIDFQSRHGKCVPMQAVTAQLHDTNSKPSGYLGIVRDITDERHRTARMQEAQRLEVMGRLAGGVAHYFNNLLSIIVGHIDLLSLDSSYLASSIEDMRQAGQRGTELTKSLLAYTRQLPQRRARVDLHQTLARLKSMLALTFPSIILLEINLSPELGSVFVDEGQLQDALLNLAINAQDAMREGGTLTFVASNEQLESGQDMVCIRVSDTGPGMPEAVLSQAFEPFFTTKPVGPGTGLGLSMVYGFARQSGGHAEIQSDMGTGTTVTLYLPRARS